MIYPSHLPGVVWAPHPAPFISLVLPPAHSNSLVWVSDQPFDFAILLFDLALVVLLQLPTLVDAMIQPSCHHWDDSEGIRNADGPHHIVGLSPTRVGLWAYSPLP